MREANKRTKHTSSTTAMTARAALGLSIATFGLVGCGGGLQLNLIDAAHRKPSNVAVYFTVDRSNGDPVADLISTDFRIYEDGSLVSVDESRQTIVNPEVAAEHYTLLLVDMSGSVTASDQVPAIVEAAQQFVSRVEGVQKTAVYAFDGSSSIYKITSFTPSENATSQGISALGTFQTRDPSTNLYGAVVQAIKEMDEALKSSRTPLHFGTIVVFTDGTDRAARVKMEDMRKAIDEADYSLYAIGVGNEIDDGTLGEIGRDGYLRVEQSGAISKAFDHIGARIVSYTRRFYLLSYCSPARAGTHEVTIEAEHDGSSGRLSYQFDAKGFGPDCDPSRPPPFDTTGRTRRSRQRASEGSGRRTGVRLEADLSVEASASGSAGTE